jgi:hypothetical protein
MVLQNVAEVGAVSVEAAVASRRGAVNKTCARYLECKDGEFMIHGSGSLLPRSCGPLSA